MTEKSIYLKMSFNMFKIILKFLFLHIILLFIYLLLLFFIFYYIYIVIKIAPDFCHEYRNDMQFPSFWFKIFFYDFLKIVILTFGPFLLSMPQLVNCFFNQIIFITKDYCRSHATIKIFTCT